MRKIYFMRIGFDAKRANANNTGLGNYSRFVIDALARSFKEGNYRMYIPKYKFNAQYNELIENHSTVTSHLPKSKVWRGVLSSLWRSSAIVKDIKRDNIEIFHGLSNELPFGIESSGARSVVTIHDLIYARYPKLFKPIDRWIYSLKFSYACKHADRIIAVSECTKRDIVSFFGTDPKKIDVIYQGCDPQFSVSYDDERKSEVRAKYNLPKRFILNVGTLEERKNLMLCVKALESLPEDIHLVACGRRTPYSDKVMEYAVSKGLTHRILLLHKQEYRDLSVIYQCAEVFCYPSYFEGFGIPIIEALNCRIPVVAATGSCLEEAGGDAAIYVDPNDDKALAKAITDFMGSETLRQERATLGLEYVKRFSKERIASDIHGCYTKLL